MTNLLNAVTNFFAMVPINTGPLGERFQEMIDAAGGVILGVMGGFTIVMGGILIGIFLTSIGDEEKMKKAKKFFIGIPIGWLAGMAIIILLPMAIDAVAAWGGVDIFKFN
jgi:hypothetical protein